MSRCHIALSRVVSRCRVVISHCRDVVSHCRRRPLNIIHRSTATMRYDTRHRDTTLDNAIRHFGNVVSHCRRRPLLQNIIQRSTATMRYDIATMRYDNATSRYDTRQCDTTFSKCRIALSPSTGVFGKILV